MKWDEETVEFEFVTEEGTNYEYQGQITFSIPKIDLKIIDSIKCNFLPIIIYNF